MPEAVANPAVAAPVEPVKVAPSSASSATSTPSSPMSSTSSTADLSQQVQAALNRLLSVSSAFKDLQPGKDTQVSTREETIAMMQHYLKRLQLDDVVDSGAPRALSVVHVAGTKGKGSTCAMVERILRQAGYKTGLFTSPHLVSPCERFRINGKPIADDVFLRHFNAARTWRTVDATNVFPQACSFVEGRRLTWITLAVLGETLDLIAYAKAGILKPDVLAFTTAQDPIAMQMLEKCASETSTPLVCIPTLDGFGPDGVNCKLGLHGDYQRTNAGLAVALASTWLRNKRGGDATAQLDFAGALEPVVKEGLKLAFWPGRAQLWEDEAHRMRFYIDGAHTLRSLECCAKWFRQAAIRTTPADKRVLIFTIHHERNVAQLFEPLLLQHFDRVYFCPTSSSRPSLAKVHTFSEALEIAGLQHVLAAYLPEELVALDDVTNEPHAWQSTLSRIWTGLKTYVIKEDQSKCVVAVKDSVVDCINELRELSDESEASFIEGEATEVDDQWDENWSVLVTGSLYLGGEALDFLGWQE
ncbi:folylpolyglutamate synthase, putative [Phytophthora infestans T30-4]|uniref:tetrahydrofolate synthase n=1 Tax=Phytophthora infestans (strain T30-4) TaxID=403677 RepID=D0NUF6_PHYIT|nr:folylpolyglutamate synthase, putative [Phytophthora infestans T30-4]EEY65289.1 folylpolyglutamate synthase, putative [Phytophthora infestans T30-4]|eukprot:XP_002897353.1 folylpolyglutamate synthase, putative [Phytophthora infestans T30-4]